MTLKLCIVEYNYSQIIENWYDPDKLLCNDNIYTKCSNIYPVSCQTLDCPSIIVKWQLLMCNHEELGSQWWWIFWWNRERRGGPGPDQNIKTQLFVSVDCWSSLTLYIENLSMVNLCHYHQPIRILALKYDGSCGWVSVTIGS